VTAARWPLPAGFSEMVGVWSKGRITGPEPHKRALREASPSQYSQGNGQRATGNGQRATGNGQRATGNGQRATGNGQRSLWTASWYPTRCAVVAGRGGGGARAADLASICAGSAGGEAGARTGGGGGSTGSEFLAAAGTPLHHDCGWAYRGWRSARHGRCSRGFVDRGQLSVGAAAGARAARSTAALLGSGCVVYPLLHRPQLSVATAVSPPCRLSHPMPAISEVFQRAASPTV
jgi:hypothetical protein